MDIHFVDFLIQLISKFPKKIYAVYEPSFEATCHFCFLPCMQTGLAINPFMPVASTKA